MSKSTFLVYIGKNNLDEVLKLIEEKYGDNGHYQLSEQLYAIKSDRLSDQLAVELNFLPKNKEDSVKGLFNGLVVRAEIITGFYSSAFWEWYENA